MKIFSAIKNFFKKTFGGGGSSTTRRASRVSNYGGGGSRSYRDYSGGGYASDYEDRKKREARQRKEQKKKQDSVTNALASISKRTDALASGRSSSVASSATHATAGQGTARVLAKINEKGKKAPPDPKVKAAKDSRERATAKLKQISDKVESDRKSFDKATGNKYNANTGNKAHDKQARINQKMQLYDPNVEKWEVKHHPIASSAARGALSGVTFGGSELLAQTSKNRKKTGAEQYYQKNKNKWAELGGEVAGSLVGFGLTGEASARAVGKVAPKAVKNFGARQAEKLIPKAAIRRAAEKEAVKRFGVEGATKEVIEQIAKRRTQRAVAELGKDAAINLTTGFAADLTHSAMDSDTPAEFAKNMGRNAAINVALGGATSLVPAFRVGKRFDDAIGGAVKNADDAVEGVVKNADDAVEGAVKKSDEAVDALTPLKRSGEADNVKASLNRRGGTDAVMPEVRPQNVDNAVAEVRPRTALPPQAAELPQTPIQTQGGSMIDRLNALEAERNALAKRINSTPTPDPADFARVQDIETEMNAIEGRIDADIRMQNDAEAAALRDNELRPPLTEEEARTLEPPREEFNPQDVNQTAKIDEDVSGMGFAKGGDEVAQADKTLTKEAEDIAANTKSGFEKQREAAYKEAGAQKTTTDNTEHFNVKEQEEIKGQDFRTTEEHTKKGFTTIAATQGDKGYKGVIYEALKNNETVVDVYHDKEQLGKAARRIEAMADKDGGVALMTERFKQFSESTRPMTSNELRDQLYDVIAAVDFANANKGKEGMEDLFLAACKAGAEQTSVSGLSLRMWQKMAMSSPEYRAKAVKQQILEMFNKSKGFRKEAGKLTKGDKINMPELEELLKKNPALKKTLDALDAMGEATSVDEVQELASKALLQARRTVPMTAFDQLTQWRYVAMLSSPKTHVRNITSNIYSATLGQLRDGIASGIEDGVVKRGKVDKALEKQGLKREDYMKSTGKMSMSAWTDSHVGLASGTELHSLKSRLSKAKLALDEATPSNYESLKKKVADLESQVAEKQASYDKTVGSLKRPTAKKAQEAWMAEGYEKLVANAEKFEKKVYNEGISKGVGRINDKLSNFIGNALETSDAISLERIFRERYDKILTANGWEALQKAAKGEGKEAKAAAARLKRLEEYAAQEASYIAATDTYRNYNAISSAMNKYVKDSLFNYDAPMYKKILGGALHATMPFTKVPVNLVKRGIDYSPVGLLRSKKALSDAINAGDVTAINRACERLAEGRIGTGIAMLGAGLGFVDPDGMFINTRLDKNDTLDKRKKDAGYQDYSIEAAGRNITMEWLTPTSATVFTGVEFGRLVRKAFDTVASDNGLQFDVAELTDIPINLASSLLEPALQLSVFQGVNNSLENVVESDNYSQTNANPWLKLGAGVFTDYARSMIPTVLGQASRTFAPYDYFVTGDTDAIYGFNSTMSRLPLISNKMFGAKTNSWGQIKNEKESKTDYVKSAAKNLLSPANINKTTWDKTDDQMMELSKTLGDEIFPKNNYDRELTFGRNAGDVNIKMSNKELAEYNVQRGKSGRDAMADALNTVVFNRFDKDEKGHRTIPHADNITEAQKAKLLKEYDGKGIKDVAAYIINTPQFKKATPAEQKQIIKAIYGTNSQDDSDESKGAKRYAERYIAGKHGISADEYDYFNEVPRNAQELLAPAIESGVITYKQALDFKRGAGKTYYTTDWRGEKGGTVVTRYNKKEMMAYLEKAGYSQEEAAALFNAFKQSNAKEYGKSGYRRYGRRRRRRWRRWHRRGGGSSAKATVPTPKAIKASQLAEGEALVGKKTSASRKSSPPRLARVKAKVDLPTPKQ